MIDVTERREAEAKLRESEARLQQVREAAELGTLDYAIHGRQLWCDARALALWGLRPEAKPTLDDLFAAIPGEDAAPARAALDAALDPAGNGRYEAEFRVRLPDGKAERRIRAKGVTTPATGERIAGRRLIITVQDVTGWSGS